jgi:uncharacterized membrane protein
MIILLRACVALGFVVALACAAFHVYIAHLEQMHLTKKKGDMQAPDLS